MSNKPLTDAVKRLEFAWDAAKHRRDALGRWAVKAGENAKYLKHHTVPAVNDEPKQQPAVTEIRVPWVARAAAETAVGAAAVALIPEELIGAAGVGAVAALAKVASKVAPTIGPAGVAAIEEGAVKLAKTSVGRAIAGVFHRHAIGAEIARYLPNFPKVDIQTEEGWFKPSTIRISHMPKTTLSDLAFQDGIISFANWDESKHPRKGGQFAPKGGGAQKTASAGPEKDGGSGTSKVKSEGGRFAPKGGANSGPVPLDVASEPSPVAASHGFDNATAQVADNAIARLATKGAIPLVAPSEPTDPPSSIRITMGKFTQDVVAYAGNAAVSAGVYYAIKQLAPDAPGWARVAAAAFVGKLAEEGIKSAVANGAQAKIGEDALKRLGISYKFSGPHILLATAVASGVGKAAISALA